jgi:hypothetical protein
MCFNKANLAFTKTYCFDHLGLTLVEAKARKNAAARHWPSALAVRVM